MQGHARTAGRLKRTVTLCGRQYTLTTPGIGRLFADMEAHVVSLRADPLAAVAQAIQAGRIPEAQQDRAWRAAMEQATRANVASQAEIAQFEQSPRGLAYKLWACLKDEHAKEFPTPDDVLRLVEEAIEEAVQKYPDNPDAAQVELARLMGAVQVATGEADAGNSSGPIRADRAQPSDAASPADGASPAGSPAGPPSTDTLRKRTATRRRRSTSCPS